MTVPLTVKIVVLAWTAGELLCLVGLRWALLRATGKDARNMIPFAISTVICLVFVIWTLYGGADRTYQWLEHRAGLGWFCSHVLWRLFVTIWVVIEGVCFLYARWLYKFVKPKLDGATGDHDSTSYAVTDWTTAIYTALLIGFYLYYFRSAITLFQQGAIKDAGLEHISAFYLRICGVWFILIEWSIAILLVRGYRSLKTYYNRTSNS